MLCVDQIVSENMYLSVLHVKGGHMLLLGLLRYSFFLFYSSIKSDIFLCYYECGVI